jgi:phenylacetate-CoA ligase
VKSINSFKPVQILAYVESIYELSRFIEREHLSVSKPASIMTSAGTLLPYMREKIEHVFSAPVFNRYGSREVGDIACECSHHRGLHVSAPIHYLEILREDGKPTDAGEVGEIVITLLTNYAMPLIRYRIGDTGMWAKDPCSCGRGWPLLAEVTGRVTDNFKSKDGGVIYGGYVRQLLYYRDWIRKYQIIQEDYGLIRILIVASEQKDNPREHYAGELSEISDKIKKAMEGCRIEYEFVNDIAPMQSGKFRFTISKVA